VNEALLLSILRKAAHGGECYRTKDRRVTTLREFQLLVETAQHAARDGLMVAITPVGSERLAQLGSRRHARAESTQVNAVIPERHPSR
jgi:hypothetical protein